MFADLCGSAALPLGLDVLQMNLQQVAEGVQTHVFHLQHRRVPRSNAGAADRKRGRLSRVLLECRKCNNNNNNNNNDNDISVSISISININITINKNNEKRC